MTVEQLHLKRLKEHGKNIRTKYKKQYKILQRDTNNTKNDNIKDAICLEKNYYKDGLYLDKVTGFDPRINYTYISNGDGENEVVCPNCGKISKQKEIGDFCPYCKTNYNMEYNDKDLGTKYHYDRVVQGVNYRKITLIVDVLISAIIVYLYIATNSRTFNIYDISKILVGTVILSLILYYFFYIIDASIIVLPIKIYKDKINKNQMKFWSMMEQKNVTKKIFYNNVNYELQKYYYGEDSNNKNIIDYVISNNEDLPKEIIDRYQKDGAKQVILDDKQRKILKTMGAKTIEENLIEIKNNYIRHDAGHISDIVINLALRHDNDKDK